MSFHSIDLQLAIHKNDQAGLKQHQMMQKPSEDQVITGQETMKLAEKKLRQSTEVDKSGASGIQDDGQRGQNGSQGGRKYRSRRRSRNECTPIKASLQRTLYRFILIESKLFTSPS